MAEAKSPGYAAVPKAEGMYLPVLCARGNSLEVEGASFFDPPYEQFVFLGEDSADSLNRGCDVIQVEAEEPFVLDNTDTPTLVLNGTRDPITPLPYGE